MNTTQLIRRVLAWLPLTYGLWFLLAPAMAWLLAGLLQPLLVWISGELIFAVQHEGALVQAVVRLGGGTYGDLMVPAGRFAEVLIEVRPLLYGYGVPLFAALLLASGVGRLSWRAWLGSLAGLLLMLLFGVGVGLLKALVFDLHPSIAAPWQLQSWSRELLALGYQLGLLMLPIVTPLSLWFVLFADQLVQLSRQPRAEPPRP
ncbi:MAG: exosortase H-associated membrane protein [Pseudomonas sp.]|uniref:exosortase H-associated membrane protein n=1 Tax=Pseudomonas sp. TaxID=306 RepID=UPI0033925BB3